jgi:hypothetical protein
VWTRARLNSRPHGRPGNAVPLMQVNRRARIAPMMFSSALPYAASAAGTVDG